MSSRNLLKPEPRSSTSGAPPAAAAATPHPGSPSRTASAPGRARSGSARPPPAARAASSASERRAAAPRSAAVARSRGYLLGRVGALGERHLGGIDVFHGRPFGQCALLALGAILVR